MPTYAGDVTALGFEEGTTVYELTLTPDTAWDNRTVISVDSTKDYVKFNVAFSANIGNLTLWPGGEGTTFGSYSLTPTGASTSDADPNRRIFIVDQDGYLATAFHANTLYTIYFYLNADEINVQLSTWANVTIYFGNIECADGDVTPLVPVMPNIFTQDKVAGLPVYKGDVTALGFEEGTDVMVNTAAGNTWADAAYFDTNEQTNCLTVRFALSSVPSGELFMMHMWGPEVGWFARISDGAVWHDAGDTRYREVELLDANGNPVTEMKANTVYTLKIYHNGATAIAICGIGNNYIVYYDNAIVENNDEYVAPHVHNYTPVVTDPTCTTGGYTTYTCECGDSYVGDEVGANDHADENQDYKCDVCSTVLEPANGETLTIAQAIALAKALGTGKYSTNSYTLIVEVVDVYNTTYGNMHVTDENGDEYVLYGTYLGSYDPNNKTANRYDTLTYKPVAGDILTVTGHVGSYSGSSVSYQIQNAVITDIVAHEHDYKAVVTAPTCVIDGYTTYTCTICNGSKVEDIVTAPGHTTDNGVCDTCGATVGGESADPVEVAIFEFGANGSASHNDGSELTSSTSYTVGTYTLTLTGLSKVYGSAYDAKGNSCLKLGTSKVVGTFTFTVPEDVTKVVINVAQYKANTTKINVNGTAYTLTSASNNGAYDAIEVDTTTTKTITFTTVSGGVRCMVNSIVFWA